MTSTRQIEANRANAKSSTGPRSPAGKARSCMNALKHGLTAETLIIAGECAGDFNDLREALMHRFQPQCVLEAEMLERLAAILWRLRRVPSFEVAILEAREVQCSELGRLPDWESDDEESEEEPTPEQHLTAIGEALIHDSQFGDTLGKLSRHETTLMRAYSKTLKTLLDLQDLGRALDVPNVRAA